VTYKCILGLDPGVFGAIAFYFPDQKAAISVYDVPTVGKEINASALYDMINKYDPDLAVIEAVHAMPRQGVSSSFNFGVSFGIAKGVVGALHIPVIFVTPTKWKKHFGLNADKEKSRALAISTWPFSDHFRRKKDDGRAEAALLALYGFQINK
jgi:crossover junction endodeoxyribonuclease RuvC